VAGCGSEAPDSRAGIFSEGSLPQRPRDLPASRFCELAASQVSDHLGLLGLTRGRVNQGTLYPAITGFCANGHSRSIHCPSQRNPVRFAISGISRLVLVRAFRPNGFVFVQHEPQTGGRDVQPFAGTWNADAFRSAVPPCSTGLGAGSNSNQHPRPAPVMRRQQIQIERRRYARGIVGSQLIAARCSSLNRCRAATHPPAAESSSFPARILHLCRDRNCQSCFPKTTRADGPVLRAHARRYATPPGTAARIPRC